MFLLFSFSGILMKDLISLHAALPDRIGNGLINVRKMMMIGGMFQVKRFGKCPKKFLSTWKVSLQELIRLQTSEFPYEINRDLLNTLRVSLYLFYSEDEVYKLSFAREPRETKPSVSSTVSLCLRLLCIKNEPVGQKARDGTQCDFNSRVCN